jgi:hypothetical protein
VIHAGACPGTDHGGHSRTNGCYNGHTNYDNNQHTAFFRSKHECFPFSEKPIAVKKRPVVPATTKDTKSTKDQKSID